MQRAGKLGCSGRNAELAAGHMETLGLHVELAQLTIKPQILGNDTPYCSVRWHEFTALAGALAIPGWSIPVA